MTPRSPTTGCDSRDDRPSRHGVALPLRERERVALGEEHLGAALESRDTSLAEHGETTLACTSRARGVRGSATIRATNSSPGPGSVRRLSWPAATRAPTPTSRGYNPRSFHRPAPDFEVGFDLGP